MTEVSVTKTDNLDSQIMQYACSLPYYTKYLAGKLLSGTEVTDNDINDAYAYFLEDAGLQEKKTRKSINITCDSISNSDCHKNLLLNSLCGVEGVNALVEKQTIEFSPNLTIIYGANGSGKSGYIRLLKQAFHSRTTEPIIPNIHLASGHKATKAIFEFKTDAAPYTLNYPTQKDKTEFKQFSIFDNKCVSIHLAKNRPEFRPAGLNFFADLTDAFRRLEEKIEKEVNTKKAPKDYAALFDGESAIREFMVNLSAKTKAADLKKMIPFTEADKTKRTELEGQKVQLQALKKDKEIGILTTNKKLLETLKTSIADNNKQLSAEALLAAQTAISDCITKDEIAKNEGLENFKTDTLENVGSAEWKAFIVAANKFAIQQGDNGGPYPRDIDTCLFCRQPISAEAKKLIESYWVFIKSQAEHNATAANGVLKATKAVYDGLKFDLLPDDAVLTTWLLENHPEQLKGIKASLLIQKTLAADISSDIEAKVINKRAAVVIETTPIDTIATSIDTAITKLQENDPSEDIKKLQTTITFLNHKEKLEQHISKIESYIDCLNWADSATKAAKDNISRLQVTRKEKELSGKYFNDAYAASFNQECEALDGHFGIDISHTGASGASYKQLFLKGKNQPSQILSEGEQKVISLADFLAEINLSEITRGIIFDDPVTSLDDERKCLIGNRIVNETAKKQIVVFTHDLVFVSTLISICEATKTLYACHWIEKRDDKPGHVFINSSPSFEKKYRNSTIPMAHYNDAKEATCPPDRREYLTKAGFTALRTCYEMLVISGMFNDVVQRFAERVSVDSLNEACFCRELADELQDGFYQCCQYMEGHSHSDKYAYKKPTIDNFMEEITRYDVIKAKIKAHKKEIKTPQA
jgi:energy-coupling factor transporter ATP-binding protein EcfA2